MRTSMAMAWAPVESGEVAWGARFFPAQGVWCVVRTGGARADRDSGRAAHGQAAGGGQIALASLHRSTCSRATSSVPGVLLLTSWGTMRASYRFPVRKPECDPTSWMVSDHYAD
ncbi:hypothetical protein Smic_27890 [Streptomyces microflavus]|uniref:Uncharacterized protein n=1 Tax=Streptomyces microflavus TaxID=1919 RepID=A0A7J0CP14_STRMI|nr:hypothetical protein Smic_27890 [Streptomyces microflavus]